MWSEEEARQLTALCGRADPLTDALAIATRAVALASARGGADEWDREGEKLGTVIAASDVSVRSEAAVWLSQRLTARSARVAVLEAEKAKGDADFVSVCQEREAMRGRVAELAAQNAGLSANLTEAFRKADEQRERAEAAEGALAAERTGDAQMKRDFGARPNETLRGLVARFRDERDAATQLAARRLNGRMEAASEAERLRAERDAWRQRAEDAESRLQRMRDGISDMVKRCVEMAKVVGEPSTPCPAHGDSTRCFRTAGHAGDHMFLPTRYPCSPTCTHDAAATPGHPERVKDLSVAIARGALGTSAKNVSVHNITPAMEDKGDEAHDNEQERSEAFHTIAFTRNELDKLRDDAAEDMRAACWEAVSSALEREGYWHSKSPAEGTLAFAIKAAIEGAAP